MIPTRHSVVRVAGLLVLSILALSQTPPLKASGPIEIGAGGSSTTAACSYSIAPAAVSVGPALGTGAVAVTAGMGCDWTATSNDEWIIITTGVAGTGDGNVTYAVEANDSPSFRSGSITIAGLTFEVGQSGLQPLVILTPSLPFAVKDTFYIQIFSGTGGIGPYSWAAASGALPDGFTVDSLGRIFGTPTVPGTFDFMIEVTDHNGRKTQAPFSIDVFGPSLNVVTINLAPAVTGTPFSETLSATGGLPPYRWSVSNATLPPGLSLDQSSGVISGIPELGGSFRFTVTASDQRASTATRIILAAVYGPNDVPGIINVKYKNATKLIVNGLHFDLQANLFIDGVRVEPRYSSDTQFIVKPFSLAPGLHQVQVINRSGLASSIMTASIQ